MRRPVPGKARVHELAKEFGVDSKTVLAKLKEQGEFVKSASSTVEAPVARRLRESFTTSNGNGNGAAGPPAPGARPSRPGPPAAPAAPPPRPPAPPRPPRPPAARRAAGPPTRRSGRTGSRSAPGGSSG